MPSPCPNPPSGWRAFARGAVVAGALALAACGTRQGAPVIDRTAPPAPAAKPGAAPAAPPVSPAAGPDFYTVRR
ncbi:MAG: hypothetical protein JNM90_03950, partial [Burkholderiales bacterium]|nr:hypothetical protein [Burkholderiales bacterium]